MPDEHFDLDLDALSPGGGDGIPIETLSTFFYGPNKKEDMQMAVEHFDPRQRRFKPDPEPQPFALNYSKSQLIGGDLYPFGTKVKVLTDVVDPFVAYTLEKNTVVSVERVEVTGKKTRVICKDKNDVLWSVPSINVERVADENSEKIGRFRLLD